MFNRNFGEKNNKLLIAVINGDINLLKKIAYTKSDLETLDSDGLTVLHVASNIGHLEIVKLLLNPGTRMTFNFHVETKQSGIPNYFQSTEMSKANIEIQDKYGRTPLHIACSKGHVEIAAFLLEAKANKESQTKDGLTLLHVASSNGHLEIVKMLLENDADPEMMNKNSETPIQLARAENHLDIVDLLSTQSLPIEEKLQLADQLNKMNVSLAIPYNDLTIDKKLGQGGFGIVYKGEFKQSPVAIKKLLNQTLDSEALDEFKHEVHIMSQLSSPYTIQLYGACLEAPHYALVMEYMPQGSLYELLHSPQNIDWSMRYQIGLDVGCGLAYLHKQGVIHGDIKSLNVLLDERYRAKLADFGMAKVKITSSATTVVGPSSGGSMRWMAPELLLEEAAKNSRPSDVYSYGMVLWELGSKIIPFEKKAPRNEQFMMQLMLGKQEDISPETPPKMANLIRCCWQKREKRPNIDQAIQMLQEEYKQLKK